MFWPGALGFLRPTYCRARQDAIRSAFHGYLLEPPRQTVARQCLSYVLPIFLVLMSQRPLGKNHFEGFSPAQTHLTVWLVPRSTACIVWNYLPWFRSEHDTQDRLPDVMEWVNRGLGSDERRQARQAPRLEAPHQKRYDIDVKVLILPFSCVCTYTEMSAPSDEGPWWSSRYT